MDIHEVRPHYTTHEQDMYMYMVAIPEQTPCTTHAACTRHVNGGYDMIKEHGGYDEQDIGMYT